ncbi:MAG: hypothetical protein J3K34DRAFT_180501 [Monoraphidium minutum]|nr:MAG: hypothetical protein J3K34DRAFT_180501 [Monoraphidium minutum]
MLGLSHCRRQKDAVRVKHLSGVIRSALLLQDPVALQYRAAISAAAGPDAIGVARSSPGTGRGALSYQAPLMRALLPPSSPIIELLGCSVYYGVDGILDGVRQQRQQQQEEGGGRSGGGRTLVFTDASRASRTAGGIQGLLRAGSRVLLLITDVPTVRAAQQAAGWGQGMAGCAASFVAEALSGATAERLGPDGCAVLAQALVSDARAHEATRAGRGDDPSDSDAAGMPLLIASCDGWQMREAGRLERLAAEDGRILATGSGVLAIRQDGISGIGGVLDVLVQCGGKAAHDRLLKLCDEYAPLARDPRCCPPDAKWGFLVRVSTPQQAGSGARSHARQMLWCMLAVLVLSGQFPAVGMWCVGSAACSSLGVNMQSLLAGSVVPGALDALRQQHGCTHVMAMHEDRLARGCLHLVKQHAQSIGVHLYVAFVPNLNTFMPQPA